jgi:hypothetical protein
MLGILDENLMEITSNLEDSARVKYENVNLEGPKQQDIPTMSSMPSLAFSNIKF